jgi:hypothetical protein
MRKLFWRPSVWEQALASGVIMLAMVMLAILDVPRFPLFKDYTGIQASPKQFFSYAILICIANYGLFYLNARGDYRKLSRALLAVTGTFVALSLGFPAVFALGRWIFKEAPAPDIAALVAGACDWLNGRKLSDASVLQWTRAARVLFIGQAGLTSVLLISGLWKPTPYDTLEFDGALERARPLTKKIFRTLDKLGPDEIGELKAYLKAMQEGAPKIAGRRLLPSDRADIDKLSKAAKDLYERLDKRPGGASEGFRTTKDQQVIDAVNTLVGD